MSIKQPLDKLKSFSTSLARDAETGKATKDTRFMPDLMFSHEDYGSASLSGDEARTFQEIVESLYGNLTGLASKRTIAHLVERAILKTVDIRHNAPDKSVESRATEAVDEVRLALTAKPINWRCCVPIIGIKPPNETWNIGNIAITHTDRADGIDFFGQAEAITDQTLHPAEFKEEMKRQHREQIIAVPGKPQVIALTTVQALDNDAAWDLAKRRIRFVLDCLTYAFNATHGPQYDHYELSDDQPRRHYRVGLVVNITDHSRLNVPSELVGPLLADADLFRTELSSHPSIGRLIEILSASHNTEHEERLLNAIHWAGRATNQRRPEESFLYRAIALESLILGGYGQELTLRLSLSVTHLLGDRLRDRKMCESQIKKLYRIRSSIVHDGKYEVDPVDQSRLRAYLFHCFDRLLADEIFNGMKSKKDLDEWFECALRGDHRAPPTPS
ncbi:MAG: hypothetical protein ABSB74_20180 [Tepidisphaeraceae bacterium]